MLDMAFSRTERFIPKHFHRHILTRASDIEQHAQIKRAQNTDDSHTFPCY